MKRTRYFFRMEEGFTLLETLSAVFILSLGSLFLVAGGRRLLNHVAAVKAEDLFLSELILCDKLLKRAAMEVDIPFWAAPPALDTEGIELSLPYHRGDAEGGLTLSAGDEGFRLTYGSQKTIFFPSLKGANFSALEKGGLLLGIAVDFPLGNKIYRIQAPFGSLPLLP